MNSLSKFPSCCVTSELVAEVPQRHHRAHCFELSLGLKTRENRMIHFIVLFIVTVFINITKTINITPRGHPDAATEISLFSLTKYQIPLMVSVGFGCTRVICCQGKEAKFQFGEFPVLFFFFSRGSCGLPLPPTEAAVGARAGWGRASLLYVLGAGTRTSSPPRMNRKETLVPV